MKIEMPTHVETIIQKLNEHGFEAYAVGGCVRDSLMGRIPMDWDITTSATPYEVKKIFSRTIDTGIQHGTVTIMIGKEGFEVTTYRVDGEYEDGRRPKEVSFTSSLYEDLKRRDFTINAMAYNQMDGLVDSFEGVKDLEQKVIRCVGDPLERFQEDALRILRALRFRAQLGFEIDFETRLAIKSIAPNMKNVSKERIQMELVKLLQSDNPEYIREVYEEEIATYVCDGFQKIDPDEIEISCALPSDKATRLAALLRKTGVENAVKTLKSLKFDNETIRKVKTMVSWHGRAIEEDFYAIRKALSQMEPFVWERIIILNQYSHRVKAITKEILDGGDCLSIKGLAVNGQDLIALGVVPGKAIGLYLAQCLEIVLKDPKKNKKDDLLEEIGLR